MVLQHYLIVYKPYLVPVVLVPVVLIALIAHSEVRE